MMELSFLVTLAVFAATMTGTPGPNNMMLTASGANFGYRRTVPHLVGITLGVASLIAVVAAGLGVVFKLYPWVQEGMKMVASGYLLYLAWRIANAGAPSEKSSPDRRPMTLLEGALFQYVNPKAWAMAVSAVGTFTWRGAITGGQPGDCTDLYGGRFSVDVPLGGVWCLGRQGAVER